MGTLSGFRYLNFFFLKTGWGTLKKLKIAWLYVLLFVSVFLTALMLVDEFIPNATTFKPPLPIEISDTQADSTCSSQTLHDLIDSPLPTSFHGNVDVTAFEISGCFAIDDNKSGLYRIVHEKNFAHVVCNTTKKKFFPPSKKEKPVCITTLLG